MSGFSPQDRSIIRAEYQPNLTGGELSPLRDQRDSVQKWPQNLAIASRQDPGSVPAGGRCPQLAKGECVSVGSLLSRRI